MISIIIPAHNEEAVIARCLEALTKGLIPGEIEIIVCCNACTDGTASIARRFNGPVQVVETPFASKTGALNLGDEIASGFPRLYVDADVILSRDSVMQLAEALGAPDVFAAAPAVETIYPKNTSRAVRAYYKFWMALPYIQEGMMAAGVYAVNEVGRSRFGAFPPIISDDGYVRLQFTSTERVEVKSATSFVSAPANITDLVKIKTRSRLGVYQLNSLYPAESLKDRKAKKYSNALQRILAKPNLYVAAIPYVWVNIVSRYRARRQFQALENYTWERDNSSRMGR